MKRQIDKLHEFSFTDITMFMRTLIAFMSFAVYGACFASLMIVDPAIAQNFSDSDYLLEVMYTSRGIGYLKGSFGTAALLGIPNLAISRDYMMCIFLIVMGISTGLLPFCSTYQSMVALSVFQGLGFGVVDTMANCIIPEIWQDRVHPWLQALHFIFADSVLLIAYVLSGVNARTIFVIIMALSFVPVGTLLTYKLLLILKHNRDDIMTARENIQYSQLLTTDLDSSFEYGATTNSAKVCSNEIQSDVICDNNTAESDLSSANNVCHTKRNTRKTVNSTSSAAVHNNTAPLPVRLLICMFFFVYSGIEMYFTRWIAIFAIENGIVITAEGASHLTSSFWIAITCGRLLAVLASIVISITYMLRYQLGLGIISSVILVLACDGQRLIDITAASALLGLSFSSLYALMLMVSSEYGYSLDARNISCYIVGATAGELILPGILNWIAARVGNMWMPYLIASCFALLVGLYFAIHVLCVKFTCGEVAGFGKGRYGLYINQLEDEFLSSNAADTIDTSANYKSTTDYGDTIQKFIYNVKPDELVGDVHL